MERVLVEEAGGKVLSGGSEGLEQIGDRRAGRTFLGILIGAALIGEYEAFAAGENGEQQGVPVRVALAGIARFARVVEGMPLGAVVASGKGAVVEARDQHHAGGNACVVA
jgi:hypothetical protein